MASIRPFSTTPRPGSAGPGEGLVLAEVRASRHDVRDEHVGVGERRREAVAAAGAWVIERARVPSRTERPSSGGTVGRGSRRPVGRREDGAPRRFGRTTMGPPIFPTGLAYARRVLALPVRAA